MELEKTNIETTRIAKRDLKEIKEDVTNLKEKFNGKQVRHTKTGNLYTVFNVTAFVTTQAPMIHYRDDKTGVEWSRTANDFLSRDTINGEKIQKFELVKE